MVGAPPRRSIELPVSDMTPLSGREDARRLPVSARRTWAYGRGEVVHGRHWVQLACLYNNDQSSALVALPHPSMTVAAVPSPACCPSAAFLYNMAAAVCRRGLFSLQAGVCAAAAVQRLHLPVSQLQLATVGCSQRRQPQQLSID